MKKSVYTWIILVFLSINLLDDFPYVIKWLFNINKQFNVMFTQSIYINIFQFVFTLAGVIILTIAIIKLYKLDKAVVRWIHLSFGYISGYVILTFIFDLIAPAKEMENLMTLIFNPSYYIYNTLIFLVELLIIIALWVTFSIHLNKYLTKNK